MASAEREVGRPNKTTDKKTRDRVEACWIETMGATELNVIGFVIRQAILRSQTGERFAADLVWECL